MLFLSDIHGCAATLRALLAQFPGEDVYLLGDLIDRGPDSAAVVRYAMENKIPTLMGNHEAMCLGAHGVYPFENYYERNLWSRNGGMDTLRSFGGKIPEDVLDWMSKLPKALALEKEGILLSHTGHGLDEDHFTALWSRNMQFPKDGYLRVFGHTAGTRPVVKDDWINIDTGCAYSAYGHLTALQWPSGKLISVPNRDADGITSAKWREIAA